MNWIFLPVIAAFIWAAVNIIEKFLMERNVREPFLFIFIGGVSNVLLLAVLPFLSFTLPSPPILLLIFLSGVVLLAAIYPYYRSLQFEEVSRIVALWQVTPLFVFILSSLTVSEHFSWNEATAFVALVLGGALVSLKITRGTFFWSKAIGLMLLSSALFALFWVLLKYIFLHTDFWNGFLLTRVSILLVAFLLLIVPAVRRRIVAAHHAAGPSKMALLILSALVTLTGAVIQSFAIAQGSVALAEALLSFQPVFVFVLAIALSIKFKHLLAEQLDTKNLLLKSLGIAFVVSGLLFLSLSR